VRFSQEKRVAVQDHQSFVSARLLDVRGRCDPIGRSVLTTFRIENRIGVMDL
jgi:hypothetical protein